MKENSKSTTNILIVTQKYYPTVAPRAFRWTTIVREWTRLGMQIDVICSKHPGHDNDEIIEGARIHRVGPKLEKSKKTFEGGPNLSDVFPSKGEGYQDPNPSSKFSQDQNISTVTYQENQNSSVFIHHAKAGAKIVIRILKKIIRLLRKWIRISAPSTANIRNQIIRIGLHWPDTYFTWIIPAYLAARNLVNSNKYDAMITVSWPVSSHVVGYLLHNKITRKNIDWLVDIGDPFSFNEMTPINNFQVYGKLNKAFERKLLNMASKIVVTTKAAQKIYCKYFKIAPDRIKVIPPIITTKPETEPKQKSQGGFPEGIKMVFAGSLRRINRRPDKLLELFSALQQGPLASKLELHFWGDVRQCLDSFEAYADGLIGKKIYLHGIVPKIVADRAQMDADVLINLGNRSDYQLPSKIMDYMAMNKPIINIAQHAQDTAKEFLTKFPLALNLVLPEETSIEPSLVILSQRFLQRLPKELAEKELFQYISPYLPSVIAASYLAYLKEVEPTESDLETKVTRAN